MKEDNIVRGRDMIDRYCKSKGINWNDICKPELMEKVMTRYAFKEWDAVMASVGHGGLKEGQVVNKMLEEFEKKKKRDITDEDVLSGIADTEGKAAGSASRTKHKSGIMVKGVHDLAVRFSRCCNPVPGDEIVGFVTRGRGVAIHRTDCINILNLPEDERSRLIDAEWQMSGDSQGSESYSTEIKIYANNRIGMFADISKVFTERQIDITSMNVRTNKQGKATIIMDFNIHGMDELNRLTDKLRQIPGVLDIDRTAG
jgi:GTP pyrophosphokinase